MIRIKFHAKHQIMSTSAATPLSNEVFQENWSNLLSSTTKEQAKISYLMVEKVAAPAYIWDKIAQQLDAEDAASSIPSSSWSNTQIIATLILSAIAFIGLSLYMIL
jgi:hypothetical protein